METVKRVGRYTVPIELFTDVTAELRSRLRREGQELPSDEELAAAEAAEAEAAAAAADEDADEEELEPEPDAVDEPELEQVADDLDAEPARTDAEE